MLYIKAQHYLSKAKNLLKRQEGQGMVEYALIIAGIAIVVAGVIVFLGDDISNLFNNTRNKLK